MLALYILFGIGVVGFIIGFIWWITELILKAVTQDDKHFNRMLLACVVFNCFNLIVQISNVAIKCIV